MTPRRRGRRLLTRGRAVGSMLRPKAYATALLLLSLGLACTGPAPRVRPQRPDTPVDRPTVTQTTDEGLELSGVVSKAVVKPIDDETEAEAAPVLGPLILRVGLATDLERVDLPCCNPDVQLHFGDTTLRLDRRTVVLPAAGISHTAIYRLQVAALKDERQAQGIADYLNAETDYPAESVFDADTDLYRVRVGRFATREEAETAQGGLAGLGVTQSWVVSEGGDLENAAFLVRRTTAAGATEESRWEGRWLDLFSESADEGLPFDRHRYRGRLLFFLNDRGLLNVINELPLEEYLRGVVPKEMGPELYNELEALKAQSVAARTYTLRNLGEFAAEGYDICSTPRCQVYGGMGVEHPVTDQAIRQTNGQVVLYDGRPAETFYSATCGGHTENVEVVFPLKRGEYLRGVPCLESGSTAVQGDEVAGRDFPRGLVDQIFPPATGDPPALLSARLEQLALLADLPPPSRRLGSLRRPEVMRYVASLYDVAIDRRLMESATQVRVRLDQPPDDWGPRERRFGRYLINSALLETPAPGDEASMGEEETAQLLFELGLYLGVLEEENAYFLQLRDNRLHVRDNGVRPAYALHSAFSTFRRRGERLLPEALELMAGDPLLIYRSGGEIVSLVQPVDAPPVELGRRAPRQSWTLWKSDDDVRRAVQTRYPGFPFRGFQVLERGVSGRVGKLALLGEGGRRIEVEGLAVRWTLDVPDTWFHVERVDRPGSHGWVFRGRGWGHGVGMSQAGAFGMAVRGSSYREILEHYYTGIRLGRLKPVPPRPRIPAG
ncbi:MAG: SpoIID/LytB domain-containing protein [Thermoanaerobaculia bacterium]|nr:SpoIID/LytB domain-containing protein [Thermoanaerobaculia bacterium]